MIREASDTVPEGTVGVFDRHEQLAALTHEQRDMMRAVILSHDNDPIALFGPDMLVRKPDWIGAEGLRGVADVDRVDSDRHLLPDRDRRRQCHGHHPR